MALQIDPNSLPGRARLVYKTLSVLYFVCFIPMFLVLLTVERWASPVADRDHSMPFHLKGGPTYFVRPWQGGLFFGLFAACILLVLTMILMARWFGGTEAKAKPSRRADDLAE